MQHGWKKRMALVASASTAVLLAGCATEPRVDDDGIASYACALVEDLVEGVPVSDWDIAPGFDADEEVVVAVSVVALLGAMSSTPLTSGDDLHLAASNFSAGMDSRDVEQIEGGLDEILDACADSGVASGNYDTSRAARVEYACALAGSAAEADRAVDPWASDSDARTGDDTFFNASYGAAALLGGAVARRFHEHESLSETSQQLYAGLTRADAGLVWTSLDAIVSACEGE